MGAFSLCLLHFPAASLHLFLDRILEPGVRRAFLETLVNGSMGVASLAVVCGVAYHFANMVNASGRDYVISPAMNIMTALSCFIILAGPSKIWEHQFSLDHGLFLAAASASAVNFVFLRLASLRFLRNSFFVVGHDPSTSLVLSLTPASAVTMLLFAVARVGFDLAFPGGYGASDVLAKLLSAEHSQGLGLGLLYTAVSQVFWFFGIHGPNMLFGLEQETLSPAMTDNIRAVLANAPPPHIMTKSFVDAFTNMGGSGATLSLILATLLKSRDPGNRRLCLLALLPALFNVNEPLLFGIPLVFNPIFFLPFLLTPLADLATAYGATALDLVPRTITTVHWTTPALISGYMATGSLAGTLLQVVNLGLGVIIYIPFVLLAGKVRQTRMRKSINALTDCANDILPGPDGKKCLTRSGVKGDLARSLAEDLLKALRREEQLFLAHQPQVNTQTRRVEGVECLLRWRHPFYGLIPPPLTVALAEDCGVIDDLGAFVLKTACASFHKWKPLPDDNFLMSVNLSARQLDNPRLTEDIMGILAATGVPAHQLEVEITESVAVTPGDTAFNTLNALRSRGVKVAIDDFGMGHTSLRYLQEFPIDTVKLDKSLTEESKDGVNAHIVKSIMSLSRDLGLRTIVEGVETTEQCEQFKNLGCSVFQGFYFSKPLTPEACADFMAAYGKNVGSQIPHSFIEKRPPKNTPPPHRQGNR